MRSALGIGKPAGRWLLGALVFAPACLGAGASTSEPLRVFGAGILVAPVKEAIAAPGLPAGTVADPVFGPAGVLRERIADGEPADLYLSADLAQSRRLVEAGRGKLVIPFARNRLCVVARTALGLTSETLLERLLAPDLRLATSTPILDARATSRRPSKPGPTRSGRVRAKRFGRRR